MVNRGPALHKLLTFHVPNLSVIKTFPDEFSDLDPYYSLELIYITPWL
jgi:hypothetical protein